MRVYIEATLREYKTRYESSAIVSSVWTAIKARRHTNKQNGNSDLYRIFRHVALLHGTCIACN